MLKNHTAPMGSGSSAPARIGGSLSSALDLYVDLGVRPSSTTVFTDLGLDLFVDLAIEEECAGRSGGCGYVPTGWDQSSDLQMLDDSAVRLKEDFSVSSCQDPDDGHPSVKKFSTTALMACDALPATALLASGDKSIGSVAMRQEKIDVAETLGNTHVENSYAGDTCEEDIDVFNLQNAASGAASPAMKKTDDPCFFQLCPPDATARHQDAWNSVEMDSVREETAEMDDWDDAEIVAIHGLTKLRDELTFELQRSSFNSAEVKISNSERIIPSWDRPENSTFLPNDEFYQLRDDLETLSKRVRVCQARVGKMVVASNRDSGKLEFISTDKDERKCKPKRRKPLNAMIRYSGCSVSTPFHQAFRSVLNIL